MGSLLLSLRSRRGFNNLLALIRCFIVVAIFINVDLSQWWVISILSLYVALAILHLAFSILVESVSNNAKVHLSYILIDSLTIAYFLLYKGKLNSEFYILFLLPLITTAHFLPRKISLYLFFSILALYGITLAGIQWRSDGIITSELLSVWGMHSAFLAISTILYRIQRSLPASDETSIIAPKELRERLEDLMTRLQSVVSYNTISAQLLYRDRLVVVACLGFDAFGFEKADIYRIEFPVSDPGFPNYEVITKKKWHISDTNKYPSFRDPVYRAGHIRTWMGIPLISPSTHELIGLLSIDSVRPNAYTTVDAVKATWFAQQASMLLIESALGPAALTQATRREAIELIAKLWKTRLAEVAVKCQDDYQAAQAITKIGEDVFNVEDCSLYLQRPKYLENNKKVNVLHLIASSANQDRSEYEQYESLVTGKPGHGLTGYAVFKKRTLNLSSSEIKRSPYHAGKYEGHLRYLASGRSRQVMIVPIRDFLRKPVGALKLENKAGAASENSFPHLEESLFEMFTHTIGLILEGIRLRNFSIRQQQNLHNVRGMFLDVSKRIGQLPDDPFRGEADLEILREGASYIANAIDNVIFDSPISMDLEIGGVLSALERYTLALQKGMPVYRAKVTFHSTGNARDNLPYSVRTAFFNVGREAILNALRHSHVAGKWNGMVDVEFYVQEDILQKSYVLKIKDNGDGFSLEEKRQLPTSFGLADMLERQKGMLEQEETGQFADVVIESAPGQGTIVKAIWTPRE